MTTNQNPSTDENNLKSTETSSNSSIPPPLVMQLIVDHTLLEQPGWTMGPMMAQAAHATSAIISKTIQQPNTQSYLSNENLLQMRKVILKTTKKETIFNLSEKLQNAKKESSDDDHKSDNFIPDFHLWIEQPENIPTVIAIAPNTRPAALKKLLKHCTLL